MNSSSLMDLLLNDSFSIKDSKVRFSWLSISVLSSCQSFTMMRSEFTVRKCDLRMKVNLIIRGWWGRRTGSGAKLPPMTSDFSFELLSIFLMRSEFTNLRVKVNLTMKNWWRPRHDGGAEPPVDVALVKRRRKT